MKLKFLPILLLASSLSIYGQVVGAVPTPTPPPAANTVTIGFIGNNPAGSVTYQLQTSTDGVTFKDVGSTTVAPVSPSDTALMVDPVASGTTYFRVLARALGATGDSGPGISAPSSAVSVTFAPSAPGAIVVQSHTP